MANDFRETEKIRAPLFTDPGRRSYAELGAVRSLLSAIDPRVYMAAARAASKGHFQTATAGDTTQQGGELVMRPTGEVAFLHLARFAGDHAEVDAVVSAV